MNLATDMPHRYISLDGWEFICFVEHTEKEDIVIYDCKHQKTCDIMFLVRRNGFIRLISYNSDPWKYKKDETGISNKGIYLPLESKMILFSGVVAWPDRSEEKTMGKRLRKEKIKGCHLLTQ